VFVVVVAAVDAGPVAAPMRAVPSEGGALACEGSTRGSGLGLTVEVGG